MISQRYMKFDLLIYHHLPISVALLKFENCQLIIPSQFHDDFSKNIRNLKNCQNQIIELSAHSSESSQISMQKKQTHSYLFEDKELYSPPN